MSLINEEALSDWAELFCGGEVQIWVYRSDIKECLTSRDDSPTRFAGAPSEREPLPRPAEISYPTSDSYPRPKAPSPRGLRPQAVGEFTVMGIFTLSNSSLNPNLPKTTPPPKGGGVAIYGGKYQTFIFPDHSRSLMNKPPMTVRFWKWM